MSLLKTLTLLAALSAPYATGALAETAPAKPADTKSEAKKPTRAEAMAKAADCTKEANAKKLTGTARFNFREECKKK